MKEDFLKAAEAGGGAVILAGSSSDEHHYNEIAKQLTSYSISLEIRIASAHKQPEKVLQTVRYYDGNCEGALVYICVAEMTDALSGMVSFHTFRPVISCPPNAPNASCWNNPPGSSNLYVASPKNAARAVAQLFSCADQEYKK